MKNSNPMLKSLPAAKKIFACLVTLSMVLSLNSAFLIAQAQEDTLPPVEADAPAGDMPTGDMPPAGEGDFVGETPPPTGDMPLGTEGEMPVEEGPIGPPPEVLQDMEVMIEDLGVTEPRIKRDSAFYGLKTSIIWPIHEALVFDPVNDAELKAHHGDQMLADIKDLVDDQGIENVDPKLLTDSVEWFENKFEQISDAAPDIKDEKTDQPAEVDTFLDDFTDKKFYEHKVLEEFNEEITENKDKIETAEDVYVALKDKQDEVLEDFGQVITTVDDPEKIPDRLATVADAQEGSNFKLIKAIEILKKVEEQVPEQAKDAIEKAQEKVMEKLEEDVKAMPAIVRAKKFKDYTQALPGDETVQLSIFEELKQLPNIPQDMLEKIEEVKEFAVQKFEQKITKFEKPEVKDKFFEKLTGDDLDDIMVLEELKAKISAKQEELRKKVEENHAKGVAEFKKRFTDVQSQEQAKRFEKLVDEMTRNPNPKTLKLIQELEMEVAQDPEKSEFIKNVKEKAKATFEKQFRQEGADRFFTRISSLNPEDMKVFQDFEKEDPEFFDPTMMDQYFKHQTEQYKKRLQNIEEVDEFDRFQERFKYASPEVIETIKTYGEGFDQAMNYKMREIMEQEIMLKEREMQMQMDRDWRAMRDDFELQLRQVKSDEEKAVLFAQRRELDDALMEQEFVQRKAIMEARFANDPFCDAMCQEFQRRHMELEFENMQWNLEEDARMREWELDMQIMPDMGYDPFAGKCTDPQSCMNYCNQNPSAPECMAHAPTTPMPYMQGQMVPGVTTAMYPPPCPEGMINMPRGTGQWECIDDPYYKPPEFFKQCPPGHFWNEQKGFCQFDEETFQPWMMPGAIRPSMPAQGCPAGEYWDPSRGSCVREGEPGMMPSGELYPVMPVVNFCPQGYYWDDMRGCVREDFKIQCGPGEYFDFYENRCVKEMWTSCPAGEYWDPGRQSCIRDVIIQPVEQCQPGYFWDFYKKACVQDQWAPPPAPMPCPAGEWWDAARNMCIREMPGGCSNDWNPVCGNDNVTYSNECYANQARVGIKHWGECSGTPTPVPPGGYCGDGRCDPNEYCPQDCETGGWCGDNICQSYESSWSCAEDCGGAGAGWCGNNVCESGETTSSCPNDCGTTPGGICSSKGGTCCNTCAGGSYISGTECNCCGTCLGESCPDNTWTTNAGACDYAYCPNGCTYDSKGCPNGCSSVTTKCGNGICDNGETSSSCPSDCVSTPPTTGCGTYTSRSTCESKSGCIWCEGESAPYSCFSSGHVCSGGGMGCDYDGICESNETSSSCPNDCGTTPGGICSSKGGTCCNTCAGGSYISGTECNCCGTCLGDNCPDNTWTTSAGACDYSYCPNGCHFDMSGCPDSCLTTTGYCGDGMCNSGETTTSCPSDCGGTTTCPTNSYTTSSGACNYTTCPNGCNFTNGCPSSCMTTSGCNTYYSQTTCTSYGCIWCTETNACYNPGHVCGGTSSYCGNGTCDSGETTTSCPSDCGGTMTCDHDGICESNETMNSCPDDCGGGSGCNYNGICDNGETTGTCPNDCAGGTSCPSTIYNNYTTGFACNYTQCPNGCHFDMNGCPDSCVTTTGYCGDGMCSNGETTGTCPSDCGAAGYCGDGMCDAGEDEYSCPSDCGPSYYCGDGMCDAGEDSWSCPSDCGSASMCGDGICDWDETMDSCPSDCGGGGGGWCGDGMCDPGEYCPEDCGGGEVLGVWSIREIDKISTIQPLTIFGKIAQILDVTFNKDKPVTQSAILAYIPHSTLRANPALKARILWTEGNHYYRLVYPPRVLGVKTQAKVKFPLITVWEILTSPF